MQSILFAAIAALAVTVDSAAIRTRSPFAVKDSFAVPTRWSRVSDAPRDHLLHMHIGLKQSRFEELESTLYEVSDPSNPRYGQHLSSEEVNEYIKPSSEALDLVHEWLKDYSIEPQYLKYSAAKDFIRVTLPVSAVEQLLNTNYSVFQHEEGDYAVRTPEWSLPLHLHDHIASIQPTNSFLRAKQQKKTLKVADEHGNPFRENWFGPPPQFWKPGMPPPTVEQVCNTSAVTLLCLRTLYGTVNYRPLAAGRNKIGLNDFLGESNNRSDIHIFLEKYRSDAAAYAYKFPFVVIAGGSDQQTPDTPAQLAAGVDLEGNLDAETIIGITYPTPLTAYTTGGSPPYLPDANTPTDTNEPYMTWLDYVLGQSDSAVPQTISTSYDDDEQSVPLSYATTVCQQFAQLGARGVTLLFASGDDGVGANGTCVSNTDGKPMFIPFFPSSCPYITSVGATHDFNPEVVAYDPANGFASGGGFSNYFPRPKYQDQAVQGYLRQIGSEYAGLYNRSGRGYPDISAQGERFVTIWNGTVVLLDGTSASTPTASSVISLVNDALIAAGRKPLGFLNPFLYSRGYQAFTDVTSGSAIGCDTAGFPAKQGWDAVSGFGTPNFERLVALAFTNFK